MTKRSACSILPSITIRNSDVQLSTYSERAARTAAEQISKTLTELVCSLEQRTTTEDNQRQAALIQENTRLKQRVVELSAEIESLKKRASMREQQSPTDNTPIAGLSQPVGYSPSAITNPKGLIQECAAKLGLTLPRYTLTKTTGPPHAPIFTVTLEVFGQCFDGEGISKTAAEQAAAVKGLNYANRHGLKDGGYGGFNPYGNGQTIYGAALFVQWPDDPQLVLVVAERPDKKPTLPGGKRENGEQPLQTLLRELKEEGFILKVTPKRYFKSASPDALCVAYVVHASEVDWSDQPNASFMRYDDPRVHEYIQRVYKHAVSSAMCEGAADWTTSQVQSTAAPGWTMSGGIISNPVRSDATQNGKWIMSSCNMSYTNYAPAGATRITGSAVVRARMVPQSLGLFVPSSWVVMVHNAHITYPNYASHFFNDSGTVLGWTGALTPSQPGGLNWSTAAQYPTPVPFQPPWIEPNASGVAFPNPEFIRIGAFCFTSEYEPCTTEIPIDFLVAPGGSNDSITFTFGYCFVATGTASDLDVWSCDFHLYNQGYDVGRFRDQPNYCQVANDLEPTILHTDAVLEANGNVPIWVTYTPPAAVVPRTSGPKDGGKGSFNPYGNGQTTRGDRFMNLVAIQKANTAVAVAVEPVAINLVQSTTETMSSEQFDKWLDRYMTLVPTRPWAVKYLKKLAFNEDDSDLPPAEFEIEHVVPDNSRNATKPQNNSRRGEQSTRTGSVAGQDNRQSRKQKSERAESDKVASQTAAVTRLVQALPTKERFCDWVVIRRPSFDWASKIWKECKYEATPGATPDPERSVHAIATYSKDHFVAEYSICALLDYWPDKMPTSALNSFCQIANINPDQMWDSGYSEWLAQTRNQRLHALFGNTTYWESKDIETLVSSPEAPEKIHLSELARFYGAGYAPVPQNLTLMTTNTYLALTLQNADNTLTAGSRAIPTFTQAGIGRTIRAIGGGVPQNSAFPINWRVLSIIPAPLRQPEDSAVTVALRAALKESRAQAFMYPTQPWLSADIMSFADVAIAQQSADPLSLFMKAHLYRRITRYDDHSMGNWAPLHELGAALPNSRVDNQATAIVWGGSGCFDEGCNLIPNGVGVLPTMVGQGLTTMRLISRAAIQRPASTLLVMPWQLCRAFDTASGKALAMYLLTLLGYPAFIPTIQVVTTDDQGANPGNDHVVPAAAAVQIPGLLSGNIDIIWPLQMNQRQPDINVPVVPADRILFPPTAGPVQYQTIPANVALAMEGVAAVNPVNLYAVPSFLASWIDEITEMDWLTYIRIMADVLDAKSISTLGDVYAAIESSRTRYQFLEQAPLLTQPLHVTTNLRSALCGFQDGRRGWHNANFNVTGAANRINEAHYQIYACSIDYLNGVAIGAIKAVSVAANIDYPLLKGPEGFAYDLVYYRRLAAAQQAYHHYIRVPTAALENLDVLVTPQPVVAFLRKMFVTFTSSVVSELASQFCAFTHGITRSTYGIPDYPGPLTATKWVRGTQWMSPIDASSTLIPAFVPDAWMYVLLGAATEWCPFDPPNSSFCGSLAEDEPWGPSVINARYMLPTKAAEVYNLVNYDAWPLKSRKYHGNARIIMRLQSDAVGWGVGICDAGVNPLNNPGNYANATSRYATPAPIAWATTDTWAMLSLTMASYQQIFIGGVPAPPTNIFYYYAAPAVFTQTNLQQYLGGNAQINLPTIQRSLKPQPFAFFNGAANKVTPKFAQVKAAASTTEVENS